MIPEQENAFLNIDIDSLEKKLAIAIEALEKYAHVGRYEDELIAREALEKIKGE